MKIRENKIHWSLDDLSCPECETESSDGSLINVINSRMLGSPSDSYHQWEEIHKCSECGITYHLINET